MPPETTYSISISVCRLKILVHTDWQFSALVNINEQQWIFSFPTFLIDARTLQFSYIGDVLSLW